MAGQYMIRSNGLKITIVKLYYPRYLLPDVLRHSTATGKITHFLKTTKAINKTYIRFLILNKINPAQT